MTKPSDIGYEIKSKQVRAYELNNCESVYRGIAANTQEYLAFAGIEEDSPLKWKDILIQSITVGLGLYIFIGKVSMRGNPVSTIACFTAFFVLMGGMLLAGYLERNNSVIFQGTGRVNVEATTSRVLKAMQGKRLRILLDMPSYAPEVLFVAEFTEAPRAFRSSKVICSVQKKVQYGKYFGSTGFFYPPALKKDINALLDRLVKAAT